MRAASARGTATTSRRVRGIERGTAHRDGAPKLERRSAMRRHGHRVASAIGFILASSLALLLLTAVRAPAVGAQGEITASCTAVAGQPNAILTITFANPSGGTVSGTYTIGGVVTPFANQPV